MSQKHHYLKCETKFYQEAEDGDKKFELRKNDRDYKKYDIVHLQETVSGIRTGRELGPLAIRYILYDTDGAEYGLRPGYCIFCW